MGEPVTCVHVNEAVTVEKLRSGVALVRLRDEVTKNGFSHAIVAGLVQAFTDIASQTSIRCVVLTGYGPYFATGGLQDDLLAIQEGRASFVSLDGGHDVDVYRLPLDCPVPVVSAMQGHAIGGGLALGLMSDYALLARESYYSASFMSYGFTPGFGSTAVFPYKLGAVLGGEMLMSGRRYRGAELATRAVPYPVVPRAEVVDRAVDLAVEIADAPRTSVVLLKEHLSAELRERVANTVGRELVMHDQTFPTDEVRQRILTRYEAQPQPRGNVYPEETP